MAAEIADVADFDGEIVARLPLNVERLVHAYREACWRGCNGERKERQLRSSMAGGVGERQMSAGLPRRTEAPVSRPKGLRRASQWE